MQTASTSGGRRHDNRGESAAVRQSKFYVRSRQCQLAFLKWSSRLRPALGRAAGSALASAMALAGTLLSIPQAIGSPSDGVACGPDLNPAESMCRISVTTAPGQTVVRVIDPIVDRRLPYRYDVGELLAGDRLTFAAAGCVQTGGHGATWKDYVDPIGSWLPNDPSGPRSRQLYHGTVTVTRATVSNSGVAQAADSIPIATMISSGGAVVGDQTGPAQLLLGYADDRYGDNGYRYHDDGVDGQCRGIFGATVIITIQHRLTTPTPPGKPRAPKPFDLVSDSLDPNGLLNNPVWGYSLDPAFHPGAPGAGSWDDLCDTYNGPLSNPSSCTSQPITIDRRDTTSILWCLPAPIPLVLLSDKCQQGVLDAGLCRDSIGGKQGGHINWFDADFQGTLAWGNWSNWPDRTIDTDYNIDLDADTATSQATAKAPASGDLNMEFDANETIKRFYAIDWWRRLHQAVYAATDPSFTVRGAPEGFPPIKPGDLPIQRPADLLNGHQAVAIGLVGLDAEHQGKSEVHPVHVLAIREGAAATTNDRWAFFARASGNEGPCSSEQHGLNAGVISIHLPAPATAPQTIGHYSDCSSRYLPGPFGGTAQLSYGTGDDRGTYLTFELPAGIPTAFVAGEVSIDWSPANPTAPKCTAILPMRPASLPPHAAATNSITEPGSPEALFAAALAGLTPSQRRHYDVIAPPNQATMIDPSPASVHEMTAIGPLTTQADATTTANHDAKHVADVDARLIALCIASAGTAGGQDSHLCDAYPRGRTLPGEPIMIDTTASGHDQIIHLFPKWPLPAPIQSRRMAAWIWILAAVGALLVITYVLLVLRPLRRHHREGRHSGGRVTSAPGSA
jgi:hypothetical protein